MYKLLMVLMISYSLLSSNDFPTLSNDELFTEPTICEKKSIMIVLMNVKKGVLLLLQIVLLNVQFYMRSAKKRWVKRMILKFQNVETPI